MISTAKFTAAHRAMNTVAQKVYAAVPISEPWSLSYIISEMQRAGSSTEDPRVISGCLGHLKEARLISEPTRGLFIRVPVRPEAEKVLASTSEEITREKPMPQVPVPFVLPKSAPQSALSILQAIATRVKAHAEAGRKLADDIETAALVIDEQMSANDAETQKLRQLKQLLSSLN